MSCNEKARTITLPGKPGYEVAVRVESLGEEVINLSVAQRVMAMVTNGGWVCRVRTLAPATQSIPLPDGLGDAEATALPVQGLMAMG